MTKERIKVLSGTYDSLNDLGMIVNEYLSDGWCIAETIAIESRIIFVLNKLI